MFGLYNHELSNVKHKYEEASRLQCPKESAEAERENSKSSQKK